MKAFVYRKHLCIFLSGALYCPGLHQEARLSLKHHPSTRVRSWSVWTKLSVFCPLIHALASWEMNQEAFRQLLSAPSSSSSQNADVQRSGNPLYGRQRKRPSGTGQEVSSFLPRNVASEASSSSKAPNNAQRRTDKSSSSGATYVDRAEARRSGTEGINEYENAERLQRDFDKKIREAHDEEEKEKLRQQMKYLGGDAVHSVLVKGLDFALLEQQKAKMNGTQSSAFVNDDDLEAAYTGKPQVQPSVDTSNNQQAEKKSMGEKFRPIATKRGFKPVESAPKADDSPEYIWRDGKRMRKKKKRKVEDTSVVAESPPVLREAGSSTIQEEASLNDDREKGEKGDGRNQTGIEERNEDVAQPNDKRAKTLRVDYEKETVISHPSNEKASLQGEKCADEEERGEEDGERGEEDGEKGEEDGEKGEEDGERKVAPGEDEEDEEDIFADAGRWQGIADDSDEDEERPTNQAPSTIRKRDWFASNTHKQIQSEEDEKERNKQVQDMLAESLKINPQAQIQGPDQQNTPVEDPPNTAPPRLIGLSDSSLRTEDIRSLLAEEDSRNNGRHDDAGRRKRRRRRRGAGGNDSDA